MQNKEGTVNGGGITDRQIEQRERHQPERREKEQRGTTYRNQCSQLKANQSMISY